MSRMNTYCNGISGHPQCPGCDYCLGSEGGPPSPGYEWVQERPRKVCTCNGMGFIANRWVFTGECKCR
jgi:hypothetical protein